MYPDQTASVKTFKPAKPVYYCTWYDVKAPFGTLPLICEGGGRFDSDNKLAGWQEDSFWIGGYYGPRMEVDDKKIALALATIPPGSLYCFNVEHWRNDQRFAKSDADVEDAIRRFRHFFITAKKARPDLRFSVYSVAPGSDYWTPNNYQMGLTAWEKYKKQGVASLSDFPDRWALGGVASNAKDYNVFEWDETKEWVANFRKWQKANDRQGFGVSDKGKIVATRGISDVIDYTAVSLYDPYQNDDPTGYIRWNIEESKRTAPGRPAYPFVWPRYHNSNPTVGGQTIPIPEWRQHVRLTLQQADGCIIWGADEKEHAEHIWVALDEAERAVSGRTGEAVWTPRVL